MECPVCKDPDAYVGMNDVECLNPECLHFKEPYLEVKLKESKDKFDNILEELDLADDFQDILADLWLRAYYPVHEDE